MTFEVQGMTCNGCEQSIVRALRELPGVDEVRASHTLGRVDVDGTAPRDQLAKAIEAAGFDVVA